MEPKDVKERLEPKHLKEKPVETEKLKEEVVATVSDKQPSAEERKEQEDPEADPKSLREYPFNFEYKDGRGKVWKGKFTNTILDIANRQMVGVLRARLGGLLPVESLDDVTREINLMVAHMTFSLTEFPDWAKDLRSLDDVGVLQALYSEVLAHEGTFLGYFPPEEVG